MGTIEKIFCEIAENCVKNKKSKLTPREKKKFKSPIYQKSVCNNQYIGLIRIERNNACLSQWLNCSLSTSKNERDELNKQLLQKKEMPIFLIVLESPHKEEYESNTDDIKIPMPAMGETGKKLHLFLPKYINRIKATIESETISKGIGYVDIKNEIYRVLLVNAIQYQCSLGEDTVKYRTSVFCEMWRKEEVKDNFKSRIDWDNVKVVLNCCTNGNKSSSIRKLIQDEIDLHAKADCVKLHSYHPSSWQECVGIEPDGWVK